MRKAACVARFLLSCVGVKKIHSIACVAIFLSAIACSASDQFSSPDAGGAGAGASGGSAGASGGNAGASGGNAGASGGNAGASGAAGSGGNAGADAGVDAPPDVVSVDAGDGEACSVVTFFLDGDGDGYGGTTTASGCVPPTNGIWAVEGGDCDDSNKDVHPDQPNYFPDGYTLTGTSAVSFDYNCDGKETEAGSNPRLACHASGLSCVGSGYLPAAPARSGAGEDPYCGSDEKEDCTGNSLSCKAGAPYKAAAIACH